MPKTRCLCGFLDVFGAPAAIRTRGVPLRRRTLYPAEVQAHILNLLYNIKDSTIKKSSCQEFSAKLIKACFTEAYKLLETERLAPSDMVRPFETTVFT